MSEASFTLHGRNPDILTCIANLSNDEVFTPPEFANRMLDTLTEAWAEGNDGANIWADKTVRFLDPCTKSGVFLREITRRLTEGLADEIPDLQERVDHILTQQVFGIGITRLTAMLARRSAYCSRHAQGKHSIGKSFFSNDGNIWFERTEHTWKNGKCSFCGASQGTLDRGAEIESHAYAFIHTDDIKTRLAGMFGIDMQFDVIIGNPPYQLDDGGFGTSAAPIYHLFVEQAKKLEPRYLTMVIPSRWFAGGKGLDEFRESMLNDERNRVIEDFIDADEAFPGVDVAGGISYFLWNRDERGLCAVATNLRGLRIGPMNRRLDEFDIFVRHSAAVEILHKIWPNGPLASESLGAKVSGRKAFGFATTERGLLTPDGVENPVRLISSGGEGYVPRASITTNNEWIDKWKATISRAAPAGGRPDREGRFYGLSSIRVIPPGCVTTEAYPVVSTFDTQHEAERMCAYLKTRFVRFLISLRAANQSVTRATFNFVPDLPMDRVWTDVALCDLFGLTEGHLAYIESLVRPMDLELFESALDD